MPQDGISTYIVDALGKAEYRLAFGKGRINDRVSAALGAIWPVLHELEETKFSDDANIIRLKVNGNTETIHTMSEDDAVLLAQIIIKLNDRVLGII
jgi:hypothetical protein